MSNLLTDRIKQVLTLSSSGTTLIITVGNNFRSDDGLGPYIANKLRKIKSLKVIDAKNRPENIPGLASKINPVKTIFIDAAEFGANPGTVKIIPERRLPELTLSTHMFPLPLVAELLRQDTKTKIYFVGVQNKSLGYNKGLSEEVKLAAGRIIDFINSQGR